MREIKFRAWVKDYALMADVNFLNIDYKEIVVMIDENDYEFNCGEYELMQYTGLKDKNGTEIYEGDIVLYKSPFTDSSQLLVIEWSREDACFCFGGIRTDYASNNCEVIGNIYEHTHLI